MSHVEQTRRQTGAILDIVHNEQNFNSLVVEISTSQVVRLDCDHWSGKIRDLEFDLGEDLEPESMVRDSASWKAVRYFVSAFLVKKEEEEQASQVRL